MPQRVTRGIEPSPLALRRRAFQGSLARRFCPLSLPELPRPIGERVPEGRVRGPAAKTNNTSAL